MTSHLSESDSDMTTKEEHQMAIHPQVSVRMNSAYRAEGGGFVQLKATLDGRTLTLRAGMLSAVKVDLDELRAAIAVLEGALPSAGTGAAEGQQGAEANAPL